VKTQQPQVNRQILEEASDWFVDFRLGDVDTQAREHFDEWLRRSPEHIRAYMEVARTYVALPALNTGGKFDVEQLIVLSRAQEQGNVVALEGRRPSGAQEPAAGVRPNAAAEIGTRGSRWRPRFIGLAASLIVLTGTITAAWFVLTHDGVYGTDIGERRTLTLADGSSIDLNARSKVRVRFSSAERDVELLQGQALFEVAKDKARPFVVTAGETQVRAVGTQFDVNRRASGTTVTVIEGTVAVSHDVGPPADTRAVIDRDAARQTSQSGSASALPVVFVSAGQQLTVTPRAITAPKAADAAAAAAWTQHRLVLEGSRLSDVVEDFNRYNQRQLVIEDRELDDFHVSGVYSSTDPASLIRFLEAQPNIVVLETDQGVRITRR
jgi:transmembrane sensor